MNTPQEFILKILNHYKYLIKENSQESWISFYSHLCDFDYQSELALSRCPFAGEITDLLMSLGVDPARTMRRIPENYLMESSLESYVIPSEVKILDEYSFFECSLKTIKIPKSVRQIKSNAFYGAANIETLEIEGGGGLNIPPYAFSSMVHLEEAILPEDIKSIAHNSFVGCPYLKITFKGTRQQWLDLVNRSKTPGTLLIDLGLESVYRIRCSDGVISV